MNSIALEIVNSIKFYCENAVRTFCDFPGGWGNAISATSDNPEAAMQVLNFAYGNKEFIDLLTFGEKDVDYTSDENGVITVWPEWIWSAGLWQCMLADGKSLHQFCNGCAGCSRLIGHWKCSERF